MTVKNRIARIRLSEKIARNREYAESIGIYIVNREMDSADEKIHKNRDNNIFEKDDINYEYKSRKISS